LRSIDKPVLIHWPTSPDDNADVVEYLEANRIPVIMAPGRTAHALAALSQYAQKKRRFEASRGQSHGRVSPKRALELGAAGGTLGEHRSKAVLKSYGVPIVEDVLLTAEAIEKLDKSPLPFPVAVKIESPDIPHKTEAGVVRLGVSDLDGLKRAVREVLIAARQYKAEARIDGISVQQMATGLEVIVGAVNDRFFGPVVAFGLGGV